MDMPLKAPTPAATGEGAGHNTKNGNKSIAYIHKSYNPNAEFFIEYYALIDMMLCSERLMERRLAMCLLTDPAETISTMLEMKLYPETDTHVKRFWDNVHANSTAILAEGHEEAIHLVLKCVEDTRDIPLWNNSYPADQCLITTLPEILKNLRHYRICRKVWLEMQQNGTLDALFEGWL